MVIFSKFLWSLPFLTLDAHFISKSVGIWSHVTFGTIVRDIWPWSSIAGGPIIIPDLPLVGNQLDVCPLQHSNIIFPYSSVISARDCSYGFLAPSKAGISL